MRSGDIKVTVLPVEFRIELLGREKDSVSNETEDWAEKKYCMVTIMRRQCDEWRSQDVEERRGTR